RAARHHFVHAGEPADAAVRGYRLDDVSRSAKEKGARGPGGAKRAQLLNTPQPAVSVGRFALLDRNQPGTEPTGLGSHIAATDAVILSATDQRANPGQDRGGSRKSGLAVAHPLEHFIDVERTLLDNEALLARHRQQRIARHAVQEGGIQAPRDDTT